MTEDFYIVAITALLPFTGCMLVLQANPYHALVMRGILGAVAALVYALFGAADVALTEALVGTMLSITLYAVAVRSSLIMRVGVLKGDSAEKSDNLEHIPPSEQLLSALRKMLSKHHMRLELVDYNNLQALKTALMSKEIHTTCFLSEQWVSDKLLQSSTTEEHPLYSIQTRVQRLYEIMQVDIPPTLASLTYIDSASLSQPDAKQVDKVMPNLVEKQS